MCVFKIKQKSVKLAPFVRSGKKLKKKNGRVNEIVRMNIRFDECDCEDSDERNL